MTQKTAISILNKSDLKEFSVDEIGMLLEIVKEYSNRKKTDTFGVCYAISAITGEHCASSSRDWAMGKFMKLIVTKQGFYCIAAFRPQQLRAQRLNLTINFPYPVTRYTK